MSALSKKHIQQSISIPSGLSNAFKQELARRILTEVRDRTNRGIGADGKAFRAYTPEYKQSRDFKTAGKSSKVDLQQTGDMLAELDIISIQSSSIVIGYDTGHPDAGKVQGNVTGEFGNPSPVKSGRDFIGLPASIVNRLVAEVRANPDFQEERQQSSSLIRNILGSL